MNQFNSCTTNDFDIIVVTETRIQKQVSLENNLNPNNCSYQFTPTKTSRGDTLLQISNQLYLQVSYKKSELEFTFIALANLRKLNIIVGVIHRYSSMDLTDFDSND